MFRRVVALILILSSFAAIWLWYFQESEVKSNKVNKLKTFLEQEINKKNKSKELPPEWARISGVKYRFQSSKVMKKLGKEPLFPLNPKGDINLIITFMDEPGSNDFVLAQFNLIDVNTNNLIFEFFLRFNVNLIK